MSGKKVREIGESGIAYNGSLNVMELPPFDARIFALQSEISILILMIKKVRRLKRHHFICCYGSKLNSFLSAKEFLVASSISSEIVSLLCVRAEIVSLHYRVRARPGSASAVPLDAV